MKQTEIDWIEQIPVEWDEVRIKDIAHLESGQTFTSDSLIDNGKYPVYGGNGIRGYTNMYTNKGPNILIGRQGALCGNINFSESYFYATEHAVVVYTIKEINLTYLKEVLRAANLNRYSNSAAQPGLAVSQIRNKFIPLPPLATQHAIANYLDEKLAVIDRNISLLEQKRERYTALRKSLINKTVRYGLNPDVELRNSGIEWLGEIPKHWEVKRIKDVTIIKKGKLLETIDEQLPGYKPLLSLDYLRNDIPQFDNFVFTDDKELHVTEDDIIVVWDGAGSGDILKGKEGILSSTIAKISVNEKIILTKFFYNLRFNLEYKLKSLPTGMGIPHINSNVLKEFEIPIPPLSEQVAIAEYLDKQSEKIDRIVENINAQLGKLAQLKKNLINECVTGEREVEN
ncbi:MAG: restriction endonuclease subunit S [Petrimonas sp.]